MMPEERWQEHAVGLRGVVTIKAEDGTVVTFEDAVLSTITIVDETMEFVSGNRCLVDRTIEFTGKATTVNLVAGPGLSTEATRLKELVRVIRFRR